jgi:hypothetical protein
MHIERWYEPPVIAQLPSRYETLAGVAMHRAARDNEKPAFLNAGLVPSSSLRVPAGEA